MKKILLIDDDREFTKVLDYALKSAGYEVCVLNKPKQSLETVLSFKPDLIISDIVMPDVNGPELVSNLKLKEGLNDFSVIFLSGILSQDEEGSPNKITVGGKQYNVLPKPLNMKKFFDLIEYCLN